MAGRSDLAAQLERVRLESDTLYAIISAVGSSLDLSRVLNGIVELVTEATECHACFVYLRDGERLRMRAASRIYAHLVGEIEFTLDEGLTGWVARTGKPAFIREDALSDPRMKYVPQLEEERFQSMVAVPVPARSGEVLGVVVLHTAAPREFDEGVLNFLVHTASLVAGAIENARLYEETRLRVDALTNLAELSERIVAVNGREELYRVLTGGVRRLLGCDACQLQLRNREDGALELVASDPPGELPEPHVECRAALRDEREELGALVAVRSGVRASPAQHEEELLQAVANQAALALRNAEHIERLTAENLVRALFEALEDGALDIAEANARAAGCDLARPHVFIHARPVRHGEDAPAWPAVAGHVETRLRNLEAGALVDAGREALRGLLPLAEGAERGDVAALRDLGASEGVAIGISAVRSGADAADDSLRQAEDAATIARALTPAGGALAYDELGAYRYLVHLALDDAPHDRLCEAVERLLAYDERRETQLLATLEQYLAERRVGTSTARKLFIHANTLRQRLDRIEKLTGLELATEDLLSLELAVKLVRLRRAVVAEAPPRP
ncbi:MAG TPA: GAF domain-containing protein [Solirubrobacteraceae bacterium]